MTVVVSPLRLILQLLCVILFTGCRCSSPPGEVLRTHEEVGARREEGREGGREEECTKRDLGMEGGGMREKEREREREREREMKTHIYLLVHFTWPHTSCTLYSCSLGADVSSHLLDCLE